MIVPESGLRSWVAFPRRYHDAVADYPPGSTWSSGTRAFGKELD